MKKFIIAAAAAISLSAFTYVATSWKSDLGHSSIQFTVNHNGLSEVSGYIKDFAVTITGEAADFSDATINFNAKSASIDTRIAARDNHLKSADFFEVEKYPEITFTSTSLNRLSGNNFIVRGSLTMHGVTKPVQMYLKHINTVTNPQSNKQVAGFQLTGLLRRSDFGIGPKFPAQAISDEVYIKADGEFSPQ